MSFRNDPPSSMRSSSGTPNALSSPSALLRAAQAQSRIPPASPSTTTPPRPPARSLLPSDASPSPLGHTHSLARSPPSVSHPDTGFLMGAARSAHSRQSSLPPPSLQHITTSFQPRQHFIGHRPSWSSLLRAAEVPDQRRVSGWSQSGTPLPHQGVDPDTGLTTKSRDLVQAAVYLNNTRSDPSSHTHSQAPPGSDRSPASRSSPSVSHGRSVAAINARRAPSTSILPSSGPVISHISIPFSLSSLVSRLHTGGESNPSLGDFEPKQFSQATLERAKRFRDYMELKYEFLRLLEVLPPLGHPPADAHSSAPVVHPSSYRSGRVYNPLQTMRNRATRKRSRLPLDPGPEQWEDVERVRTWVSTVIYTSTKPNFYGHDTLPLPEFAEHTPPRPDSHPDSPHPYDLPLGDWIVRPSELFADQYWLEQDGHKAEIENHAGDLIYPEMEKVPPGSSHGSGHGSVSSRRTNMSSGMGGALRTDGLPAFHRLDRSNRGSLDSSANNSDNFASKASGNPLTRVLVKAKSTITSQFRHDSHSHNGDGSGPVSPTSHTPFVMSNRRHGSDPFHHAGTGLKNLDIQLVDYNPLDSTGDLVSPRTQGSESARRSTSLSPEKASRIRMRASLDETRAHSTTPPFPPLRRSASHTHRNMSKLMTFVGGRLSLDESSPGDRYGQPDGSRGDGKKEGDERTSRWRSGSISRRLRGRRDRSSPRRKGDEGVGEKAPRSSTNSSLQSGRLTNGSVGDETAVELSTGSVAVVQAREGAAAGPSRQTGTVPEPCVQISEPFPNSSAIQTSAIAEAEEAEPAITGRPPKRAGWAGPKASRGVKSSPGTVLSAPKPLQPGNAISRPPLVSRVSYGLEKVNRWGQQPGPPEEGSQPQVEVQHQRSRQEQPKPCGLGWDDRFRLRPNAFRVVTGRDMKRMEALTLSSRIRAQGMVSVMTVSNSTSGAAVRKAMATARAVTDLIAQTVDPNDLVAVDIPASPTSSRVTEFGAAKERTDRDPDCEPDPDSLCRVFAPVYKAPVIAAVILRTALSNLSLACRVRRDQSRLETEAYLDLFGQLHRAAEEESIPMADRLMDEIGAVEPVVVTQLLREYTSLDDRIDRLVRRQRRRYVAAWVRRGGYWCLEWALVSVMWFTWMVVMLARMGGAVFGFAARVVRWLFWL